MQATWQSLVGLLTDSGISDARQEASIILQHVTRQSPTDFFLNLQRPLDAAESNLLDKIVGRRVAREPLQYILTASHFYGREFYVDSRVLIPRPETEHLIDVFKDIASTVSPDTSCIRVADVGTGSGVIAVTLACEAAEASIVAIDRSRQALEVAHINVTRYRLGDRICLVQGDLLDPFRAGLDVVAANLPYIRAGDIDGLIPEVSHYEPREALDGGADGLRVIAPLCAQAVSVLNAGGWLLLEIGDEQADDVLRFLRQQSSWDSLDAIRDLRGTRRIIAARRAPIVPNRRTPGRGWGRG